VKAPLDGRALGLRWGGFKETRRMLDTILEHPFFWLVDEPRTA
jgi:hypothetical protein